MYKVTAYFKTHKVTQKFYDLYDAIDWRDSADAHYPKKVKFEEGIFSMRESIYNMWNAVMNADYNPLRHIPSLQTRHMILQILAWTWASSFALAYGSMWIWGFSVVAHLCIIAAIVITVATFETARRKPTVFNGYNGRGNGGEHE